LPSPRSQTESKRCKPRARSGAEGLATNIPKSMMNYRCRPKPPNRRRPGGPS